MVILVACMALGLGTGTAQALSTMGGEVLAVDLSAGKLTIATPQAPVTFMVTKATKIDAGERRDLRGVMKGDTVTVEYEGKLNQYVAKTIVVLPK